jgi:hypothetical protein
MAAHTHKGGEQTHLAVAGVAHGQEAVFFVPVAEDDIARVGPTLAIHRCQHQEARGQLREAREARLNLPPPSRSSHIFWFLFLSPLFFSSLSYIYFFGRLVVAMSAMRN